MKPSEDEHTTSILAVLDADKTVISDHLGRVFFSFAFGNDHTIGVGQLPALSPEELESFIAFVHQRDPAIPAALGKKRAFQGICAECVVSVNNSWGGFLMGKPAMANPRSIRASLELINDYTSAYMGAYFSEYKNKIIGQQREIRLALSAVLRGKQQELFIRNHSINSSINAILLADMGGRVTHVNPSFLKIWGYATLKEVLEIGSIRRITSREVEEIFRSLREMKEWSGKLEMTRKDGERFVVEMSASAIVDDVGNLLGSMASFVDITEKKRTESQLTRAGKMEALGQLAAGITHDFNNTFAAVKGYIQLIMMSAEEGSQLFDDANQIRIAIERSAGLIKQLQYFARGVRGERSPININAVVKESHELIKHTFPLYIDVITNLESEIWLVEADPSEMNHAIINFCINSRDAIMEKQYDEADPDTPTQHRERITITTENIEFDPDTSRLYLKAKPGRYIRLSITDTGVGMSHSLVERIFEPFYSTKKSKKNSGLGLSIIYGIVEKVNGFIDVESEPGTGATFKVYIPASEKRALSPRDQSSEAEPPAGERTVLVVDDEQQIRDVVARFLKHSGYRIITASNGSEAVSLYEEEMHKICLVILDLVMPEMDGETCLKTILKINPDAKIILLTGFTTEQTVFDIAAEHVVEIIEKPFDLFELTHKIKKVLEKKKKKKK
jgi:two-component system, cell cycle sensor histidine kinase and response regulator CckA